MSEYFDETPSINDEVVMARSKYNELIDVVNQMADKLERTIEENEIMKKQIAKYNHVNIDEALGKYRDVLNIGADTANDTIQQGY
jgi:hypothetical protein